jgi:hypothetical protein
MVADSRQWVVSQLERVAGGGGGQTTPHGESYHLARCDRGPRICRALMNTVMKFGFHKIRGMLSPAE